MEIPDKNPVVPVISSLNKNDPLNMTNSILRGSFLFIIHVDMFKHLKEHFVSSLYGFLILTI